MHGNTKMIIWSAIFTKNQKYVHPGIISKPSFFTKVKLKWPLSRGSHFTVHFCLEFRRNRESSQYFHGVSFSKDCKIINLSYMIIPFLLLSHKHEHWLIHTKSEIRQQFVLVSNFFFLLFSVDFNKQNILANNN